MGKKKYIIVPVCTLVLIPIILIALLFVPAVQMKLLREAQQYLFEQTGIELTVGKARFRPLFNVSVDDIMAVDHNGDTLLNIDRLTLASNIFTLFDKSINISKFRLERVHLDTRGLLGGTSVRGDIAEARIISDHISLTKKDALINVLQLNGADISYISDEEEKEDKKDSTIIDWVIDVRHLSADDVKFSMPDSRFEVVLESARASLYADIGKNIYSADTLYLRNGSLDLGGQVYSLERFNTSGGLDGSHVSVKSLQAVLDNAIIDGSAAFDIDDIASSATYDLTAKLHRFRLDDIIKSNLKAGASGKIHIDGHGASLKDRNTKINLYADLSAADWDHARLDSTVVDLKISNGNAQGSIDTDGFWDAPDMNASVDVDAYFDISGLHKRKPSLKTAVNLHKIECQTDSLNLLLTDIFTGGFTRQDSTVIDFRTTELEANIKFADHILDVIPALEKFTKIPRDTLKSFSMDHIKTLLPQMAVSVKADSAKRINEFLSQYGAGFGSVAVEASFSKESTLALNFKGEQIHKDTLDINDVNVKLWYDSDRIYCDLDLSSPPMFGLGDTRVSLDGWINNQDADIKILAGTTLSDGFLSVDNVNGEVGLDFDATFSDGYPLIQGKVDFSDLMFNGWEFGNRSVDASVALEKDNIINAKAKLDDFPMMILGSILAIDGVTLGGSAAADLFVRGKIDSLLLSGNISPKNVTLRYEPLDMDWSLEDKDIPVDELTLLIEDFHVFGVDNTSAILNGTYNIGTNMVDLRAESKKFRPAPFRERDTVSYFGNLTGAIALKIDGPTDKIHVGGDVSVLPETDITYKLGSTNHVRTNARGDLKLEYCTDKDVELYGTIVTDGGEVVYTLPFYPLAPFKIDKGSHVDFNGPLTDIGFSITATQKAKAMVSTVGDRVRDVDFNVGLIVGGSLDDISLHFKMEALNDALIQREIAAMSVEEQDRIAGGLLVTGMYNSATNASTLESGYALASLLQRNLNTIAENKLGNFINIDLGMGGVNNAANSTYDYSMKVSKSFFDNKLKLTVGGKVSSKQQSSSTNSTSARLDNISADYFIGDKGKTSLSLFHKWDYENILDGEITKDGMGVATQFSWNDKKGTSNPYILDLQGNVSYRSNQQFGPDISATLSKNNMLGLNETLSARVHGAYYLKIKDRERSGNDTYNFGVDLSMSTPELLGDLTTYNFGYLLENIYGAKTMNKFSLDASHRFRTGSFITHDFSPLSVSIVQTKTTSEYIWGVKDIHMLIYEFIQDEYIPAIKYGFTYDNTPDKTKTIGTMFSFNLKESGNIISGIQCLFGKDFNATDKKFLFGTYNQFLKGQFELRNIFRLNERNSIATRILAGAIAPYGNSTSSPTSELFYSGGANSIRAFAPRSIGPGGYHSKIYNLNFYHSGDIRGEMNIEYRFPLFWMLEGAVFLDAGNVWNWKDIDETLSDEDKTLMDFMMIPYGNKEGFKWNNLLDNTALGTGLGIRFVYQSIIIRLDTGIALHYPYDTGVPHYYNVPNFFKDGLHFNFGIGYPF